MAIKINYFSNWSFFCIVFVNLKILFTSDVSCSFGLILKPSIFLIVFYKLVFTIIFCASLYLMKILKIMKYLSFSVSNFRTVLRFAFLSYCRRWVWRSEAASVYFVQCCSIVFSMTSSWTPVLQNFILINLKH